MARGRRWVQLRDHLEIELRRQRDIVDTYDADFIIGSIQKWLSVNDCALTGEAVRPFRRPTAPQDLAEPKRKRTTRRGR